MGGRTRGPLITEESKSAAGTNSPAHFPVDRVLRNVRLCVPRIDGTAAQRFVSDDDRAIVRPATKHHVLPIVRESSALPGGAESEV